MTYDCFRDRVREVPAHSKISADVGVIDAQNLVLVWEKAGIKLSLN